MKQAQHVQRHAPVSVAPPNKNYSRTNNQIAKGKNRLATAVPVKHDDEPCKVLFSKLVIPSIFDSLAYQAASYNRIRYTKLTFIITAAGPTTGGGGIVCGFIKDAGNKLDKLTGEELVKDVILNGGKSIQEWNQISVTYRMNSWYYTSKDTDGNGSDRWDSPGHFVIIHDQPGTGDATFSLDCAYEVHLKGMTKANTIPEKQPQTVMLHDWLSSLTTSYRAMQSAERWWVQPRHGTWAASEASKMHLSKVQLVAKLRNPVVVPCKWKSASDEWYGSVECYYLTAILIRGTVTICPVAWDVDKEVYAVPHENALVADNGVVFPPITNPTATFVGLPQVQVDVVIDPFRPMPVMIAEMPITVGTFTTVVDLSPFL